MTVKKSFKLTTKEFFSKEYEKSITLPNYLAQNEKEGVRNFWPVIWEIDDIIEPVESVSTTDNYQRFFLNREFSGANYLKIGTGAAVLMILTALNFLPCSL